MVILSNSFKFTGPTALRRDFDSSSAANGDEMKNTTPRSSWVADKLRCYSNKTTAITDVTKAVDYVDEWLNQKYGMT
eukprot:6184463-Pleurochrysis_carterae.AAC.2